MDVVQGELLSTTCSLDVQWGSLSTNNNFYNCRNVGLAASSQPGTGMNKNSDTGTSPVPE